MTGPTSDRNRTDLGVCVVGLGRVGLAVAAAFATRGVKVTGVDQDPRRVAMANAQLPADDEPGLAEALTGSSLSATTVHVLPIRRSSITYVIVPTPSDDRGAYELSYVVRALEQIGHALADVDDPHTVVLASTVLPGATRSVLQPVLERAAGRRVGDRLSLCYSPPFVALGSVLADFLNPDFALLGVADGASDRNVKALYEQVLGPDVPIKSMSIENAELTKLAVNTYLTMKITFANTLAALCDHLPGGNVDAVADAVGTDHRIGPQLLRGGLGYGGPCLPRDNAALALLAESVGVPTGLPRGTDAVNRLLADRMTDALMARLTPGSTVVILGLAYKPDTSEAEASPALQLAQSLARSGIHVVGYDQRAARSARHHLGDDATRNSIRIVEETAALPFAPDLVVLATPDAGLADAAIALRPMLLADPWRVIGPQRRPPGTEVIQTGRPTADAADDAFASVRNLWATSSPTYQPPALTDAAEARG
ncbi:MAG: UDPglucose 6-dehydrogenase [Mycobacterium sp.]|jgi:UDPglucose 6-dehydrogenase|nr:UDPglucose 6-dehydrogenase [Mycobacterium sp.]